MLEAICVKAFLKPDETYSKLQYRSYDQYIVQITMKTILQILQFILNNLTQILRENSLYKEPVLKKNRNNQRLYYLE